MALNGKARSIPAILAGMTVMAVLLATPPAARSQTGTSGSAPAQSSETRPTTTTASGDTGLWLVPTAEVLRHKKWSISFYEVNADDGQGFIDIVRLPLTFGIGLGTRVEVFGNWALVTAIDHDTRPLFFESTAAEASTGTGGGLTPDYPLLRSQWTGHKLGDLWLGGKFIVLASSTSRFGLAVRGQVKLPVGDDGAGVSSGEADFQVDGIISKPWQNVEVSGYGGVIVRGNPTGYELTNGFRWGAGAAFPNIFSSGFKVTAELVGEQYFNQSIIAPAGLIGDDGSRVPTESFLKNPVLFNLGVTWQAENGFFVGGGGSWNLSMKPRSETTAFIERAFQDVSGDQGGFVVRIGFSSGTRRSGAGISASATTAPPVVTPPAPTATPTPAATPVPTPVPTPVAAPPPVVAPPANRAPTTTATCDPCRVEPGRTATVSANAQDPDGDALTYQWTAAQGTLSNASGRQSQWTAPQQPGRADVTVSVNDGKGGTSSATVSIEVVKARPTYAFEDVYFDFDRSTLRPATIAVLKQVAAAMQADPELNVEIEGHACSIGTTPYNQALGDRRANAVRNYLVNTLKISATRLRTVSYGETRPAHDNKQEVTRKLNRRVVLVAHAPGEIPEAREPIVR